MKHVKIFSVVLLFSFLGSIQNQVLAQGPNESLGASAQAIGLDQYLENGDFKTKFENDAVHKHVIYVIIYKASDNATVRKVQLANMSAGSIFKSISLERIADGKTNSGQDNDLCLCRNTESADRNCRSLSVDSRNRGNLASLKILNTSVEPTDSAYFQLESDGRLVIYSGTGGTPILELANPW